MRSIRLFLTASILATLILFNFIAVLQGFQSSMDEAEILFDNQLLDASKLVANLDIGRGIADLSLGNNLAFQVWDDDVLLARSSHAPELPITDFAAGFNFANFNSYRWRTYASHEAGSTRWTIVAERTDLRFELAENVVLESVFPILISIPLVGLLIWSIISYGLRPLRNLSMDLRNKQAGDLSPVISTNSVKELKQVVDSINGFILRLSSALNREKRFSADAAHELRTPVSALKIQLYNLRDDIDTQNDSYLQLHSGVDRMQHLIEQLLSLYRTTSEQFADNCTDVNLYRLTQNQLALSYPLFEQKNQNLELRGGDVTISGDQFALETLVSNLLTNANKYTPECGSIVIQIDELDREVCLSVEDSGLGIEDADKERVFDRFYRLDKGVGSNSLPGCGLGLTIVAHIVELHNARVVVENSQFPSGCAFRVYFKKVGYGT